MNKEVKTFAIKTLIVGVVVLVVLSVFQNRVSNKCLVLNEAQGLNGPVTLVGMMQCPEWVTRS